MKFSVFNILFPISYFLFPISYKNLWRWWLRVRFVLTQRHRHNRLVIERVGGLPFVVLPEVFNPTLFYSSELLAQYVRAAALPESARVLDLGTGSGVLAISAAQRSAQVVAVEINPAAVRCTRINVLLNRVEERVEVLEGDLFAPVAGRSFDLVLFNPPYFRGAPANALDHAFRATDVIERFAAGLAAALAPGGRALIVISTNGEHAATLQALAEQDFTIQPVAQRDMVSEIVTIYQVMPHRGDSDAGSV